MASSGNFSTLNPLDNTENNGVGGCDFDIGNCQGGGAGDNVGIASTIATGNTGKYYAEFYLSATPGTAYVGYYPSNESAIMVKLWTPSGNRTWLNSNLASYAQNGYLYKDGSSTSSWGSTFTTTDIIQIAIDADNDAVYYGKNNTWQNSGNPESGASKTGAARTSIPKNIFPAVGHANGSGTVTWKANFGQDSTFGGTISAGGNADANGFGDFKYAPPSGYTCISSSSIPISDDIDPAQTDDDYPSKQFGAVLYTGNGGSPDNAVSGLGFRPDLVWGKARSASQLPILQDTSRGQELLFSSSSNAAQTSNGPFMASYDSDGFTFDGSGSNPNDNGVSYVAWCWKANGGVTSTNSDGSTDSTVQANTKAGFSIVQTPNYSGTPTFGHGLTKALDFIIVKLRASASQWIVYHSGLSSAGKILYLNQNAAEASNAAFNSTAPTNEVFSLGGGFAGSGTGIAYCWHSVEGMQRFGKYEGNGNADGPFIYLGFRPRMVCIKSIDSSQAWIVCDTARETFNPLGEKVLQWNTADAEYDPSGFNWDVTSNGFKIRSSDTNINAAQTYIYMAWADVPFKYNNTF
tara:strand:- start:12 stop:1739 length:1728 start_codon:yes stop_codon:yes gene_type:complete